MTITPRPGNSLLTAVGAALDFRSLLRTIVERGVSELDCNAGSAYVLDPSSGRLELTADTYGLGLELSLAPGQGIAGLALTNGARYVAGRASLSEKAVRIEETRAEDFRSIVALAVPEWEPAFVFCFDFHRACAEAVGDDDLTDGERARVAAFELELRNEGLVNALLRSRTQEGLTRIRQAAERPGRLRQEVSGFLSAFYERMELGGRTLPLEISFRIIDRRRKAVRTIQTLGALVTGGSFPSVPFESQRPHAEVVKRGLPRLILEGRDAEPPEGDRLLRVLLPLFPAPLSYSEYVREAGSVDALFRSWIDWQPANTPSDEVSWTGCFREEVLPAPPPEILFAILEVVERRAHTAPAGPAPEELEAASWIAVEAWKLSKAVFEATLAGALDGIGRAATLASCQRTELTVAMPDWRSPERLSYPVGACWPIAVPEVLNADASLRPEPAAIRFVEPLRGSGPKTESGDALAQLLKEEVPRAVHLALRLDDYVSAPYLLAASDKADRYTGTKVPDPELPALLEEICREAGADSCAYYEMREKIGRAPEEIDFGYWVTADSRQLKTPGKELTKRLTRAFENGRTIFDSTGAGGGAPWFAILPVVLFDGVRAALVLDYPHSLDATRQTLLEGQVVRWAHRLSIRRLAVLERFSERMGELRAIVSTAGQVAASSQHEGQYLRSFVEGLAHELQLPGLVLMLYSRASGEQESGVDDSASPGSAAVEPPPIVRRFWSCKREGGAEMLVDEDLFVDGPAVTPGHRALEEGCLVVHRPGDHSRATDLNAVCRELEERAEQFRDRKEAQRAEHLDRLVELARGTTTTIVTTPLAAASGLPGLDRAALSVFLDGDHRFDRTRERLVQELADLVAEGVARVRQLDRESHEKRHSVRLDQLRRDLAHARSEDELIGHLFRGMGSRSRENWNLADDAVLWVLDPLNDELVMRSGRGGVLEAFELGDTAAGTELEAPVLPPKRHPWGARHLPANRPRKDPPIVEGFQLDHLRVMSAGDPLCRAYASLGARWLLSFPVQHPDGRVLGLVDCLLASPLVAEERLALEAVLRRLSHQLAASFENTRHRRVIEFARELTEAVMKRLSRQQPSAAYEELVGRVRAELACAHCDLFLELEGGVYLHTTTRGAGPKRPEERYLFEVEPGVADPLLRLAVEPGGSRIRLRHASRRAPSLTGLAEPLASLVQDDYQQEAMALLLQLEGGPADSNSGLLLLTGPLTREWGGKSIKRSGILTNLDQRRALDLAVVVQRLVATTRLVEHQTFVIDELQHSVGQPLQVLRSAGEQAVRALRGSGADYRVIAPLLDDIREAAQLVEDGRNHIAAFARMGQLPPPSLSELDFAALVNRCCRLKSGEAQRNGVLIQPPRIEKDVRLRGDAPWLRQAVLNLLDNAIKYSWRGREVQVEIRSLSHHVELSVSNFGIGIPEQHLERVFDPYFRSRVPDAKGRRRGSGIGLAVARHAIEEIHGGRVRASSRPVGSFQQGPAGTANVPHLTSFTVELDGQGSLSSEGGTTKPQRRR